MMNLSPDSHLTACKDPVRLFFGLIASLPRKELLIALAGLPVPLKSNDTSIASIVDTLEQIARNDQIRLRPTIDKLLQALAELPMPESFSLIELARNVTYSNEYWTELGAPFKIENWHLSQDINCEIHDCEMDRVVVSRNSRVRFAWDNPMPSNEVGEAPQPLDKERFIETSTLRHWPDDWKNYFPNIMPLNCRTTSLSRIRGEIFVCTKCCDVESKWLGVA